MHIFSLHCCKWGGHGGSISEGPIVSKSVVLPLYTLNVTSMTSALFFEWLIRFNSFIRGTIKERELSRIDNCSAHGRISTLPEIDHVEVVFLPPNTISKLQPLDAGIIASLKANYRRRQLERAVDLIDINGKDLYSVEQLMAMRWIREICKSMNESIIKSCWENKGLFSETSSNRSGFDFVLDSNDVHVINGLLERSVPQDKRMYIKELLCSTNENKLQRNSHGKSLVQEICFHVNNGEGECASEIEAVI